MIDSSCYTSLITYKLTQGRDECSVASLSTKLQATVIMWSDMVIIIKDKKVI